MIDTPTHTTRTRTPIRSAGLLLPAVRLGGFSAVWRPRVVFVAMLSLVGAVIVSIFSLGIGDFALAPDTVVRALLGFGTPQEQLIVMTVRLPRILTGIAAGVALALAGALMQSAARNALASPDLLGVTAGASAGAVAVITLGGTASAGGFLREVGVPGAALVGAAVATALVFLLLGRTGVHGIQPLLVGIGVSAFFTGLVSWFLIAAPIKDAGRANVWLTGSINQRSWPEFWPIAIAVLVSVVVLIPLAHRLDAFALGLDIAKSVGIPIGRIGIAFVAISVMLTAVSAAAVGPLGFVALVAPHLARIASGATRAPLLGSAAIGALLVAASDLLARTLLAPIQLPAGAVIAVIGGPFLIWLLISQRRRTTA